MDPRVKKIVCQADASRLDTEVASIVRQQSESKAAPGFTSTSAAYLMHADALCSTRRIFRRSSNFMTLRAWVKGECSK